MCLYPKLILNKKYTETKKNNGIVPQLTDPRVKFVPIGCGNCMECTKQKAREWQIRLLEDIKTHTNGKFITLTFSNEQITKLNDEECTIRRYKSMNDYTEEIEWKTKKIPLREYKGYAKDNAIATRAVRLFLERYRKQYGKSLRHWLVTELGHEGTENIHLHGIIWCSHTTLQELESIWQYGHIWKGRPRKTTKDKIEYINYVNATTIGYITKYVYKKDEQHSYYKSIILSSPGIGHNYTQTTNAHKNKFNHLLTNETYRTSTGHKMSLPIYWRNKIYTEEEREKLWIQKIDQNTRYINGEKIDISNGYDNYFKLRQHHRRINTELGYGSNYKDNDEIEYQNTLRTIMQHTRFKNAITAT